MIWKTRDEAGSFHKLDRRKCGYYFSDYAYEANVVDLVDGVVLPSPFLDLMASSPDKGVFLIEGRGTISGMTLRAQGGPFGSPALQTSANLSISSVMDMFRWLCLRSVAGDARTRGNSLGIPQNRPDSECDDRHYFFVHGFNVNPDEAVSTGVEMFKRLWQSVCQRAARIPDSGSSCLRDGAASGNEQGIHSTFPRKHSDVRRDKGSCS